MTIVNLVARTIYDCFVLSMKAYQRLFMDVYVWGRENIPKGPKIYVANHITSHEIMLLTVFPERVHVVVGPACKSRIVAGVARMCEQINAMPANRSNVVSEAVRYLRGGGPVFVNPEGDIQNTMRIGRFYPGVARMYRQCEVPIVPIAVLAPRSRMREYPFRMEVEGHVFRTITALRGPYCINIGKSFHPCCPGGSETEQDEAIVEQIRSRIASLVDDARTDKFWM